MRSFLIVLAALVGAAVPGRVAAQAPQTPAGGPRCFQLDLKVTENTPSGAKCLAEPRIVTQAGRPACFVSGGSEPAQGIRLVNGIGVPCVSRGLACVFKVTPRQDGLLNLETEAFSSDMGKLADSKLRQMARKVQAGDTVTLRAQETRSEKAGLVRWTEVTITVHEVVPPR